MRRRASLVSMASSETKESVPSAPALPPSPPPTFSFFPLLAASYYILTATSLTLFNKVLFARFPASHPPFLLFGQSVTAVFILTCLRALGHFQPPPLSTWRADALRTYAPLYVSNLVMLLTSLIALKFTSLLMYNTLRRTSMVFVVAIHCALHKTSPSPYTLTATALVTLGALWAGTTDLAYDPFGYALAFTANLSTAIYLVLLRPVRDKLKLSNLQLIFVNALANIPVLAAIMILFPAKSGLLNNFHNPTYSLLFLCSCALAVVINHAVFVNTTTNDAIAQSIASQLKDVVLLMCSIILVDDAKQRASGNLQGVLLGFSGSIVYGIGKLIGRNAGLRKQEETAQALDKSELDESERVTLISSPTARQP